MMSAVFFEFCYFLYRRFDKKCVLSYFLKYNQGAKGLTGQIVLSFGGYRYSSVLRHSSVLDITVFLDLAVF